MKELLKTGAVCLMVSMISGAAIAGTAKVTPPEAENKPKGFISEIIEETKLTDDGSISYEEYKVAREAVIKKRMTEMKAVKEKRDKEKFLALDTNKDGKVSKTELLALQNKMGKGPRGKFGRGHSRKRMKSQGCPVQGMGQRCGMDRGRGPKDMNCGQGQPPCFDNGQECRRAPGMRNHHKGSGFEMIMMKADKDKDGSLTNEELNLAVTELFGKLDTNKDGKLEKSELSAGSRRRGGKRRGKSPKKDTKEVSTQVDTIK